MPFTARSDRHSLPSDWRSAPVLPMLPASSFIRPNRALNHTLVLWRQHVNRNEIAAQARETVRLAVAAQRLAMDHGLQAGRTDTEGLGGGIDDPKP